MPNHVNTRLYTRTYRTGTVSPAPSSAKQPMPEPMCAPLCADCGRLECLCRPRFFAGQLLTEQDLNRLDAYIRGKNRLHTLQLHGWGVVNGLQVHCEPCGTGVVVGTGYAISPCGDDIVVCRDTAVDVCDLVKKCRRADPTCQPYQGTVAKGCEDLVEDWVLAIRYAESPARGVAALRMGPTCSCGASPGTCSCGQTQATCGCGKPAATCDCGSMTNAKPRNAIPECEPTAICEGYSFDVCPAPKPKEDDRDAQQITGPLWERFMCCLQPLADIIPSMPGEPGSQSYNQNPQAWNLWCCQTKQTLIAYFSGGPEFDCTLVERLVQWPCPDPNDQNFADQMTAAVSALGVLLFDAILACFCHALLPPAPCGTTEDRIPLAVVQVRKRDCKVISVCNFTPLRKTMLTFPNLEYWLSWIPWWSTLCDVIHQVCCTPLFSRYLPREERSAIDMRTEVMMLRANPQPSKAVSAKNEAFSVLLKGAVARSAAPLDPKDVVGGLLGVNLGGKQPLSKEERANAPQFLLLNQVLRPVAASLASMEQVRNVAASVEETQALKARITKLEETVKKLRRER